MEGEEEELERLQLLLKDEHYNNDICNSNNGTGFLYCIHVQASQMSAICCNVKESDDIQKCLLCQPSSNIMCIRALVLSSQQYSFFPWNLFAIAIQNYKPLGCIELSGRIERGVCGLEGR
jgi:hypothetical protein